MSEAPHATLLATRPLESSVASKPATTSQIQQQPPQPARPAAEIQSTAAVQQKNPAPPAAAWLGNSNSSLPPPSSAVRPPAKTKQILVNGKTYTVMKPLGRGGSSVVYQVSPFNFIV